MGRTNASPALLQAWISGGRSPRAARRATASSKRSSWRAVRPASSSAQARCVIAPSISIPDVAQPQRRLDERLGCEAEAAHPGVDLHVRARADATAGVRDQRGEGLRRGDDGREVVRREDGRLPGGEAGENDDRHGDAGLAQRHPLLHVGHGQACSTLLDQGPGDGHRAVPVRVRLHHRHHGARGGGADGVVVGAETVEVDPRAGRAQQAERRIRGHASILPRPGGSLHCSSGRARNR